MIHVFHGLLGSPQDFSFLSDFEVRLHDLYEMNSFPEITSDDILIGYSMGGRVALEIAHKNHFKLKQLVLISAHPGLESDEEKIQRQILEDQIIEKLTSLEKKDFLQWWNSLEIFRHDFPIDCDENRFKKSQELFERFRLSRQSFFLHDMIKHKEKILYVVGLSDHKYMDLVSEMLLPHDIEIKGIPGGHRLFQTPEELKKILLEEGIL